MIHLLPLALAKAKWKIPGFEESSSDSIVAERIVSATTLIPGKRPTNRVAKGFANAFPTATGLRNRVRVSEAAQLSDRSAGARFNFLAYDFGRLA
jgi:hypothetical protein